MARLLLSATVCFLTLTASCALADTGTLAITSIHGGASVLLSTGIVGIPAMDAWLLVLLVAALCLTGLIWRRGHRTAALLAIAACTFTAGMLSSGIPGVFAQSGLSVTPAHLYFTTHGESNTVTLTNPHDTPAGDLLIETTGRFAQSNDCPDPLPGGTNCTIIVTYDAALCSACDAGLCRDGACVPPPDPDPEPEASFAPPLDPTVSTTTFAATSFLYTGDDPVQQGVEPQTIEERRVAVVRGQVHDRAGNPLAGVRITIQGRPEFGHTHTREDGLFDLAVNGGGVLVVDYAKDGYLPAQRKVRTPWQDYVWAEDVVLLPLDPVANPVDLGGGAGVQVARGSAVADEDGQRTATVVFPPGTQGVMQMPDGSTVPLGAVTVRATEYTVGESGPQAMPGELPPTSGYTYAAELSVDEAMAAGARHVRFDRPVYFYVDNFLEFPVGGIVPAGWYDRDKAAWIPSDNGRVIAILAIEDGLAVLDVTGSGNPASESELAALDITDEERAALAGLYAPAQSLWRTPVEHFTPWDCNWPYGPPEGAVGPENVAESVDPEVDEADIECGSIIECQTQVLAQRIPISGTPFSLNYRSDRAEGRVASRSIRVPVMGGIVPDDLVRVRVEVVAAGRKVVREFPPEENQVYTYVWDGLDGYGRNVPGVTKALVRIGYVYKARFLRPNEFGRAFAAFGTGPMISGSRAQNEVSIWAESEHEVGVWNAESAGLGGWSVDMHHSYSAELGVLIDGGGRAYRVSGMNSVIQTIAGVGEPGFWGDGGEATSAALRWPSDVTTDASGNVYIVDRGNNRIRKVSTDGVISTVAGSGGLSGGFYGDGGPAVEAALDSPWSVALDREGNILFSDTHNHRIRKVDVSGQVSTIAGSGGWGLSAGGFGGDGGPATEARLYSPGGVSVDDEGNIFFVDIANGRVRKVSRDGIISTVSGNGDYGYSGDGGPAKDAAFQTPIGMDVGSSGDLYIADLHNSRVRRVGPDGVISTVAGNGVNGFDVDGVPADQAPLYFPEDVAVGKSSRLYISDTWNIRVRVVGADGTISTYAGTGEYGSAGDGGRAAAAGLKFPSGLHVDGAGNLYVADESDHRVRKISPRISLIDDDSIVVSSRDGGELFTFDSDGRHVDTRSSIGNQILYRFDYTDAGKLNSIFDSEGNATVVERDGLGVPVAIIASDGQRTELELNADGYLARITNPGGESHRAEYTADGLMTRFVSPRGHASEYAYDELGRLVDTTNPVGGGWTLARSELANGHEVELASAEGLLTRYRITRPAVGGEVRTNTWPDGTVSTRTTAANGDRTSTDPDGTVRFTHEGPDPRFGMVAPVPVEQRISTPAGRSLQQGLQRTATLDDPTNPLSHSELLDTLTINGRSYTQRYTAVDRTRITSTPLGRTHEQILDALGRPEHEAYSGLAPLAYERDARGRLTRVLAGASSERITDFAWSEAGDLASITDALDRITAFDYDPVGRVTRQTFPDGRSVEFAYDANGNLTSVIPPGRDAHLFEYTEADQPFEYDPPELAGLATVTRHTYDLDKRLTRITRPDGEPIDFAYDDGGRLATVTTDVGETVWTYRADTGQPASVTAPDGHRLDFTWDGFLPIAETATGEVAGSIIRSWDDNFWLRSIAVNGQPIALDYDADGLLTAAGALQLARDAQNGLITQTTLGTVATEHDYNAFGEPTLDTTTFGATEVFQFAYTRDAAGRITARTETLSGASATDAYAYDQAGRLVSHTRGGVETTWSYDANGNRSHVNDVPVATYDAQDRLLTYASTSYTYTENGELESKTIRGATTTYDYDALGNLRQVTLPGDVTIDYLIDARNRRVGKKINGTLVQGFLYQDQLNPIAELDGAGNITARFIYADKAHVPAYMQKGGATYRIISDHLGSPRLVIDTATGDIAQRLDYDPWGRPTLDTNPGFQPFGFAGGIHDVHTGLVRFGARDYDPETGRWTAKDPIGFGGGDGNLYGYAGDDPVNWIDPEGELPSLPQGLVDFSSGLGDGIVGAFTLGLVTGQGMRDFLDIDGGVEPCSRHYAVGNVSGTGLVTVLNLAGAAKSGLQVYQARSRAMEWRSNSRASRKTRARRIEAAGTYRPAMSSAIFTAIGGHGVASWKEVINNTLDGRE